MEQRAKLLEGTPAAKRTISLQLTKRWAEMLFNLCRKEREKREKIVSKSTFVPEPGKVDTNQLRAEVMEEIMAQLGEQLGPEYFNSKGVKRCTHTPD